MPFVLIVVGFVLIVTGAKDTHRALGSQLASDFTGPGNFTYWLLAMGGVGALGYIDAIRSFANTFMALIIIVMIVNNPGFFSGLMSAVNKGPEAAPRQSAPSGANTTISGASANQGFDAKTGTADLPSGWPDITKWLPGRF